MESENSISLDDPHMKTLVFLNYTEIKKGIKTIV